MNIVLCGFMGSGKTVVGKELAKIMGRRFVDTDQLVEARSGVSIPAIFQVHGEDYFRELERAACAGGHRCRPVAYGAAAVARENSGRLGVAWPL